MVGCIDMSVLCDQLCCDFVYWVMVDILVLVQEIVVGSCSDGFVVKGKIMLVGLVGSCQGLNDFIGWFVGNLDMVGDYLGYDGFYLLFNDECVYCYFFCVFVLDVVLLQLLVCFIVVDVYCVMYGYVLVEVVLYGIYMLNLVLG